VLCALAVGALSVATDINANADAAISNASWRLTWKAGPRAADRASASLVQARAHLPMPLRFVMSLRAMFTSPDDRSQRDAETPRARVHAEFQIWLRLKAGASARSKLRAQRMRRASSIRSAKKNSCRLETFRAHVLRSWRRR
jgi:hypothetical protein